MEVEPHRVSWITDYLTDRPQFVRIGSSIFSTLICSTGAPLGAVLSPLLFTLYTPDFKHDSELWNMQTFLDDTAIVVSPWSRLCDRADAGLCGGSDRAEDIGLYSEEYSPTPLLWWPRGFPWLASIFEDTQEELIQWGCCLRGAPQTGRGSLLSPVQSGCTTMTAYNRNLLF